LKWGDTTLLKEDLQLPMISPVVECAVKSIEEGTFLSKDEAWDLLQVENIHDLLYGANRLRQRFKGNSLDFCSIVNARSGKCSENCFFCAQSSHYDTKTTTFPLVNQQEIFRQAKSAGEAGACRFGIVTSGRGIHACSDLENIAKSIRRLARENLIARCASLGELSPESADLLLKSGLQRYHHNLETSERFFPKICTTHTCHDRVKTIRTAREAGLEICSGGIFGMGEDWDDRIELALTLRVLDVDSVPLNFLVAVKGTPFQDTPALAPMEILKIIALFRYLLPTKDIKVCGGREVNLGDFQSWIYYAGANGTLIGNYLTTLGRPPEEDHRMAKLLNLAPKYHPG
jgi:biotin synthase